MRALAAPAIAIALCGCAIAQQIEDANNKKKADAAFSIAQANCDRRAQAGELKGLLALTECHGTARAVWWKTRGLSHEDLLALKNAKRAAIAASYDNGNIDNTQLKLANAEVDSEIMSILEHRTAQRNYATAAMMQADAAQQLASPKTCSAHGNSVTCY